MERPIDKTNKNYIPAYIVSNNGNRMVEKNFIRKIRYGKKNNKYYLLINNKIFGEFDNYKSIKKEIDNINSFNKNFSIRKKLNNKYKVGVSIIEENDTIFDFSNIDF